MSKPKSGTYVRITHCNDEESCEACLYGFHCEYKSKVGKIGKLLLERSSAFIEDFEGNKTRIFLSTARPLSPLELLAISEDL